ncbi:membrane protein insertase YidC [Enterococcus timonensis]|uniref:membrane protein insertase YidC n=1 Tax=Enterococcus timonensis TaxID=1852364 RepID=UPI0008D9B046|nr:membrane protein insertase YidC [Enterococcus timonensis]
MKKYKKLWLSLGLLSLVLVLAACGTAEVTSESSGLWDKIVYFFAQAIQFLSIGGNIGIGIILFTIIIRLLLLPLMNYQTKSMRKTQELQPKIKAIKAKYPFKDQESQRLMNEETQRLYKDNNVNMYAGCLPIFAQMPVMIALYQSISRVPELRQGHFLWLDLSTPDPYYILPILAAVFTFLSSYLASMSQLEKNSSTTVMNFVMPLMIFFMGMNFASSLSLYWVVSNAFQVGQTLLINNPFKIRNERQEALRIEKEKERALAKALSPKKKKNKKR